jgi:hypothetical protein
VIVNIVVVLVGYLRVVGTCISRDAASGWRFFVVILCGGECWLFSSFLLSFPGICFSFLYVVLLYSSLWNYVPLFLYLCFWTFLLVVVDWWFSVVVLARSVVLVVFA